MAERMTQDQIKLMQKRVGAALKELNEALEDAQRFGLRTSVFAIGHYEKHTAGVKIMVPSKPLSFPDSSRMRNTS